MIYGVIGLTVLLFSLLCVMGIYKGITEDKVVRKELRNLQILKNAAVRIDSHVENLEAVLIKDDLIPNTMRDNKNQRITNGFKGTISINKLVIENTPVIHIVSTNISKQKCKNLLFNLAYQSDKLVANNITIKNLDQSIADSQIIPACQQEKTTVDIYYKY